ncbi:bifunctional oligoribonuclease/PAP phosphatase NrnA [Patescibacteria group bacterium]
MEPKQQIEKLLGKSSSILILLPSNANSDLISASYALSFLFEEKKVKSTIVVSNKNKAEKLNFLPQPKTLKSELSQARDFILAFNTTKNKIANVRTEEKKDELRIYISPEKGSIRPQDFSFIPAKFNYDLVITLGATDKESLGKIFENNPDIFYEVPVINIDNHSNNDEFGQVNIVDVMSSSVCEILTDLLLGDGDDSNLPKPVAQCLLTGIIDATESFQNKKTTPKSLQVSARLMGWGADQQEIIRHLYKTQPLHILKLWGRVMAKLNWNSELQLVWSSIAVEDFVQSRSNPEDAPLILDKIQKNYSSGKIFMLVYNEIPNSVKGIVKSSNQEALRKISLVLNGKMTDDDLCEFQLENCSEDEIENKLLGILRNK